MARGEAGLPTAEDDWVQGELVLADVRKRVPWAGSFPRELTRAFRTFRFTPRHGPPESRRFLREALNGINAPAGEQLELPFS